MKTFQKYILLAINILLCSNIGYSQNIEEYQPTLADSVEVIKFIAQGTPKDLDRALILSRNIDYQKGEKKSS